jgi:hypothetical protein
MEDSLRVDAVEPAPVADAHDLRALDLMARQRQEVTRAALVELPERDPQETRASVVAALAQKREQRLGIEVMQGGFAGDASVPAPHQARAVET